MGSVYLGKIHLRWCHSCNLPILEEKECPVCGASTIPVEITPPGDARPAFSGDIELIRRIVASQFGEGTGRALLPDDALVIMNRAPDLDRMDEIIVDGEVLGSLRYDIVRGFEFLPRAAGALRLSETASKGIVNMDEGAYAPVIKGASALAVGVLSADSEIKSGQQALLKCCGRVFAGGRAKMDASEMLEDGARGSAVKVRWTIPEDMRREARKQPGWDDVVTANKGVIEGRVERSITFIKEQVEKHRGRVAVSYSGGKDSLATLSLVLEAGIKPEMFFINTGIDLPETVENARTVAEHFSLNLTVADAGDAFWRALEYFGPPAKDYRWCCKTCKLGPTVQAIKNDMGGETLSFIGQRAYESQQRRSKGETWENPWTPGQHGASPIQHWTALHVWLYIFDRKLPYNIWYERGMERVGCFLCPTMDLGEAEIMRDEYEGYAGWEGYLREYFEKKGLGDEWVRYGLWRWKRPPGSILKRLEEEGISVSAASEVRKGNVPKLIPIRDKRGTLLAFDGPFDMKTVALFLNTLSPTFREGDGSVLLEKSAAGLSLHPDGSITAKDPEKPYKRDMRLLEELIYRASECVGCGICPGRCPTGALGLENYRIVIDVEKCAHCSLCLDGPCPVVDFGHRL